MMLLYTVHLRMFQSYPNAIHASLAAHSSLHLLSDAQLTVTVSRPCTCWKHAPDGFVATSMNVSVVVVVHIVVLFVGQLSEIEIAYSPMNENKMDILCFYFYHIVITENQ